jgi:hypothetical protein
MVVAVQLFIFIVNYATIASREDIKCYNLIDHQDICVLQVSDHYYCLIYGNEMFCQDNIKVQVMNKTISSS